MTGTPAIATFWYLGGNPADWEIKRIWETSTEYYLVAVNRRANVTTFISDDGRTSVNKVLYSTTKE